MSINKILTITNTSHLVGEPRAITIEGNEGTPSVKLGKLLSVYIDLYKAQLDDKFADVLYNYAQLGFVKVLLDGVELSETQIGSLKYFDSSSADGLVKVGATGSLDYLSDVYFAQSSTDNITPVQKIDDTGTGLSDLWSADKIDYELSLKAEKEHVHFTTPRAVFQEQFTGDGFSTTFTLTGSILNGAFTTGTWNILAVLTTFPSDITGLDSKPTYDSTNIFSRNRISVVSISAAGVVTLDYAPRAGIDFYPNKRENPYPLG